MIVRFTATERQLAVLALNLLNGSSESLVPMTNMGYVPNKQYKLVDIETIVLQFLKNPSSSTVGSWLGRGIFILFNAIPKQDENKKPELGADNSPLYECVIDSGADDKKYQTWLNTYASLEDLIRTVPDIDIKPKPEEQIANIIRAKAQEKEEKVNAGT